MHADTVARCLCHNRTQFVKQMQQMQQAMQNPEFMKQMQEYQQFMQNQQMQEKMKVGFAT